MKRHNTSIIGLTAFAILSFSASAKEAESPATARLETYTVQAVEVPGTRVLNGQVEAVNKSTVSAQTNGTIEELNYDVGDFVEKGSVIAKIVAKTQQAGLKQAEASVEEARASVARARAAYNAAVATADEATADFNRVKEIFAKQLISQAEYDRANAAMKSARAQVGVSQAALEAANAAVAAARARKTQAGEQLGYTEILAPYSGIVTDRHVELGEVVSAGHPIMTGISLEQLRVATEVPQEMIQNVRQYKQASIYILGDKPPIEAKSLTIFPYADPLTNAFKVRAELGQKLEHVYPGTFVKVEFVVGKDRQLTVPEEAVAYRGEVTGVYVVGKNGVPALRQVRLGRKLPDGRVLVLAGLDNGEVIARDPVLATLYLKRNFADQPEQGHE